jgi:exodeoxyribonuclease III
LRKGFCGTAVFTKIKPVSVEFNFGNRFLSEGRSTTLEFSKFILVTAQFPSAGAGLKAMKARLEWDAQFYAYVQNL